MVNIDALVEKHQSWSAEFWLQLSEEHNGIEFENFTLKHFVLLRGVDSPYLVGGIPTEADTLFFLWAISPGFSLNKKQKLKFFKKVKKYNMFLWSKWIKNYLSKSFGESDTMSSGTKGQTNFATYFIDAIAREYGWTIDQIMKIPLGIVFQLLTAINERNAVQSGKEYKRVTELDNQINRYILDNSNS